MKAYKKRAKGSWTQGKGYKGDREERQYSKREILQLLREAEEDFLHRHRKSPRSRNQAARLEYRVFWYEQAVSHRTGMSDSYTSWLRSGLEKARASLTKFLDDKKGQE